MEVFKLVEKRESVWRQKLEMEVRRVEGCSTCILKKMVTEGTGVFACIVWLW